MHPSLPAVNQFPFITSSYWSIIPALFQMIKDLPINVKEIQLHVYFSIFSIKIYELQFSRSLYHLKA